MMIDLAEIKRLLERATPGQQNMALWGTAAELEVMITLQNAAPALIAELEAARECVAFARMASLKFIDKNGKAISRETMRDMTDLQHLIAAYDAATKSGGGNADR